MKRIDTHAHIFLANTSSVKDARYVPNYDASLERYEGMLKELGFTHGVLIQPSFLGVDNSYMLNEMQKYDNLRAVVVAEPLLALELFKKHTKIISGLRLNLISKESPDFNAKQWKSCLSYMKEHGLHVEIHKEAEFLEDIIKSLLDFGVKIVIDHLARPKKARDLDFLEDFRDEKNIFFKVSGFYRINEDLEEIRSIFLKLLRLFGDDNFVFGSDFPFTNFESKITAKRVLEDFYEVVKEEHLREKILNINPSKLFGFSQ